MNNYGRVVLCYLLERLVIGAFLVQIFVCYACCHLLNFAFIVCTVLLIICTSLLRKVTSEVLFWLVVFSVRLIVKACVVVRFLVDVIKAWLKACFIACATRLLNGAITVLCWVITAINWLVIRANAAVLLVLGVVKEQLIAYAALLEEGGIRVIIWMLNSTLQVGMVFIVYRHVIINAWMG